MKKRNKPGRPPTSLAPPPTQQDFGRTWWGEQWIGSLERFAAPQKWKEGKHLAWARLVTDIGIEKGRVAAQVSDFSGKAYGVKLSLAPFTSEQ